LSRQKQHLKSDAEAEKIHLRESKLAILNRH
jgi:hypothetical protein